MRTCFELEHVLKWGNNYLWYPCWNPIYEYTNNEDRGNNVIEILETQLVAGYFFDGEVKRFSGCHNGFLRGCMYFK